ncbi:MAG: HAMP domain-containing histidine kinase [Firmicutes bacterium]|nr:HAMP domain-containing histidine kinase [Bacillota bacterium]
MYISTFKILNNLNKMLDDAADGKFSEKNFTEHSLSRLESKMHRYLSAGKTEQKRIIQERNAIKTLVGDISHQTKTPISNILLYTSLLGEAVQQNNVVDTKEILPQIQKQSEKLNFLIQLLVKTSRLESGVITVTPENNSIKELLSKIDHKAAAQQKNINITIDDFPDTSAVFDLKWTAEAISNIVDNAVKYTPPDGKIFISVKEFEMFVSINIRDTGIGMNEEETAKIFTRFYRAPSVSSEPGVGIGLYLTRIILKKEDGYVKVKSQPGKGSEFSVFLLKNSNLSEP